MNGLRYKQNLSKNEEQNLKDNFSIEFGKNLKKVRLKKGLTQEELAYRANLHSTYVGHIETGTYTPSIFVVWKLTKGLNCKIEDLL